MRKFKKTIFVDAETAVRAIESNDRVVLGNFCAEPFYLPDKLMERAKELKGVKIFHCTPFGRFQEKYLISGMEEHIRCITPFCGRKEAPRKLIQAGKADFVPVSLGKVTSS
jgi:acyl-CoA hydrolase